MRRTFLTLYTSRSYKSQKQIKPLASDMPRQKHLSNKEKTKTSITKKKQKSSIDIKNKKPLGLKRNPR